MQEEFFVEVVVEVWDNCKGGKTAEPGLMIRALSKVHHHVVTSIIHLRTQEKGAKQNEEDFER